MWKLSVGVAKKVGRPNYGSHGASLTLEAEIAGGVFDDPDELRRRTRELFVAARAGVDEELAAITEASAAEEKAEPRRDPAERHPQRRATPRQVRALEILAERVRADLPHLATYYFRVDDVTQLTRRQAGLLIARLQAEESAGLEETPAA